MRPQVQETSSVAFSPRRIGHANIYVSDLEQSMRFYNKICGFEEVFREPGFRAGFLSNGNTHHDVGLIEASDQPLIGRDGVVVKTPKGRGEKAGLNHFGWEMQTEQRLVDAYNRAEAAGVPVYRKSDHTLTHSITMFDPDGNLHEFYADCTKEWRSIFDGTSGATVTARWDPNLAPPSTEPKYHMSFDLRRVEEALIHAVRFTHTVLMTRHFKRMVKFFTEIAGLKTAFVSPDGTIQCLAGAGTGYIYDVALLRQEPGIAATIHHFGFELANESEFDAAEHLLTKAGIEIEMRIDHAIKRSFFIKDPDSNRCEFYVLRDWSPPAITNVEMKLRPYLL